ncbi:MAG: hypothetical protein F6K34_01060 [Okeania sp. SIO4D6]|nr:hypothetical protein [Okeania sp. SIO4D6]
MVTSPTIRKWFAGMLSSITPYTLRSNMPEVIAKGVYLSTPCVYEDDNTNKLTKVHTLLATDAANTNIAGFAVFHEQVIFTEDETTGLLKYTDNDIVTLLTIGDIAVKTEVPVKPGDDVYFRHTSDGGSNTIINMYTNVAGTGVVPIVGAKFVERTEAAGITLINVAATAHIGT